MFIAKFIMYESRRDICQNREKFLEELEAVKSIAASQDNKLAKDEVKNI